MNMLRNKAQDALVKLYKDEDGGELLEYALIAGLIVIAAIGAIKVFSGALSTKFTQMSGAVNGEDTGAKAPAAP